MVGLAEILYRSIRREELSPDEEHEVHEGPELYRLAVAGALFVFVGPEAEVEANGDQFINVVGSGVRRGSCHGEDVVHDSREGGFFLSDRGIFEAVGIREEIADGVGGIATLAA